MTKKEQPMTKNRNWTDKPEDVNATMYSEENKEEEGPSSEQDIILFGDEEEKKLEDKPGSEEGVLFIEELGGEEEVEPEPVEESPQQQPRLTRPTRPSKDTIRGSRDQLTDTKLNREVPQVLIDDEVFYRVEGDLLLDIDEFAIYQQRLLAQRAQREAAQGTSEGHFGETAINETLGQSGQLVGILQDDKIVRWAPGTILSYCVLEKTFPRREWYVEVVENMQLAADAWEQICGIDFEYHDHLDDSDSVRPEGVLFPVRYISAGGAFIAAAFFPTDPTNRRRVLIDGSYFTTSFDHVGVLRHELGHVLGFRHEHIRSGAPPACPDEDVTETINLTDYDPKSVMHYFCGRVGSRNLAITDVDRFGSQQVYGPPLTSFRFFNP